VKSHIDLSCPNCQRLLRVRTEYDGKRIACKYCTHAFVAAVTADAGQVAPAPAAAPQAAPSGGPPRPDPDAEAARQRFAQQEAELQRAVNELAARTAELTGATEEAQRAREDTARLEQQLLALQSAAREAETRQSQELSTAQANADRLNARVAALQKQVAEMEGGLRDAAVLATRLRKERGAAQTSSQELTDRLAAAEDRAQELETRLRDAHAAAQAASQNLTVRLAAAETSSQELTARLATAEARVQELDSVRADRDNLVRERGEDARQVEQLQAQLRDLERVQAEATAAQQALVRSHEEARDRWEAERQELHGQWGEKESAQARLAEERLCAAQKQAAAEREELSQQLEALSQQLTQDRAAWQSHEEQAREQVRTLIQERQSTVQQLDALRGEREQLAARGQELEEAYQEAQQRFQGELDIQNAALAEMRLDLAQVTLSRDELQAQVETLNGERASLQRDLELACNQMRERAIGLAGATEETQRAQDKIARLEQQVEALQGAASFVAARHGRELGARQQELVTAYANSEPLSAEIVELEQRAVEAETGLHDSVQPSDQGLQERLEAAESSQQELRDRLLAAEARAQQLDSVCADRDNLARQFAATEALNQELLGRLAAAEAPVKEQAPEPARERAAVLDQLRRLQQENSRLRRWLANFGIHLD
jgi:chromosome segregation ATPase